MRDYIKLLGAACGTLGAWLCQALGGWDAALHLLFVLMGLDLLTGLVTGLLGRSDKTPGGGFLSRAFFLGLSRKVMVLALVMLATALDRMLGTAGVSRVAVIGFYAANEGMSILENAGLLGLPLPRVLRQALEKLRENEEDGDGGDGEDEDGGDGGDEDAGAFS